MSDLLNALGALNSTIQYAGAQIGAVKDKKWIAKENQKARDFQLEMWNRANEYNLPSAQMARLQEAGLNPNLVYGNGATTLSDYVSAPGHSAPNMGTKDIAKDAITTALQTANLQSGIDVNKSIVEKNQADAEKARQEARGIAVESDVKEDKKDKLKEIVDETVNNLVFSSGVSMEQAKLLRQEADRIQYMIDNPITWIDPDGNEHSYDYYQIMYKLLRDELSKSDLDVSLRWNMIKEIMARINLMGHQGVEAQSRTQLNFSEIELNEYDKLLKKSQAYENYTQGALNLELATTSRAQRAEIAQNIAHSRALVYALRNQMGLNNIQANEIVNRMSIAVRENKMNEFKTFITQKYGTNALGQIAGMLEYFTQGLQVGHSRDMDFMR